MKTNQRWGQFVYPNEGDSSYLTWKKEALTVSHRKSVTEIPTYPIIEVDDMCSPMSIKRQ